MSARLRSTPRMTVAAFIDMIRPTPDEERWELLDGEPILMSPPTERHQRVVMGLLRSLDRLAAARGCQVLPGFGILSDAADDYAPIPDIVVRCGPMGDGGYARDPLVVAEVLSPSTMNNDRGRKLEFYRSIASLRTIAVVYGDEMRIEAWQREDDGWRHVVLKAPGDRLDLPELAGRVPLVEVYADVPLA